MLTRFRSQQQIIQIYLKNLGLAMKTEIELQLLRIMCNCLTQL